MERVTRLLQIFTIFLVVFALEVKVEGGRILKSKGDDQVAHPQNFFAGFGTFPTPGLAAGVGFGPSGFCSFPGIGCVRVQPTNPGGSVGGGLPIP
uniref:Uncharacterized protein n=1 Tax=Vitis vinifera TaxID=29760 RepID=F6I4G9_VITVI